ncbi:MAG: type II secretion system ATPase GspE [Pseudomonadota bacterium]
MSLPTNGVQESAAIVDSEQLRLPFAFVRRHGVLLLWEEGPRLVCRDGVELSSIAEVRRLLRRDFAIEPVDTEQFDDLLQQSYEHGGSDSMQAMDELDGDLNLNDVAQQLAEPEDLMESQDDAPIIRLINVLLTEAVREDASDIHIESFESSMVVRFRIDGVLREVLRPKRAIAPLLISRIKVMAKLDIAEKRLPQDGRISLKVAGRAVDVRVSTLPSGHGERVVLRLLDKQAGRLDLEHLGMAARDQQEVDRLIHQPHGIILVTGPTGSGKTTTLYAALSRLNETKRNILTVEDPIEYYLDGIGQTQVNTKVDMSFARGLRAILRQDPDVVMVGEIRDLETVEIAVQASLTGHLVLSTLHTNTAVGSVTRMRDMGVEPFLLSSSLIGVLAQRLVRLLCDECKQPYVANEKDCELMGIDATQPPTLYRASEGCLHCNNMGYRGRTGIYELVTINEAMRGMIHDGSDELELEREARRHSSGIRSDGFRRVLAGETSLDEVLRVSGLE